MARSVLLAQCIAAFGLACAVALVSAGAPAATFGHARLADFDMAKAYVNLNHGSYGVVPRAVADVQRAARLRVERCPDCFFRYDVWGLMDAQRARVAAYINAAADDVAFVINASHGVNAVLRSLLTFDADATDRTVLFLSTRYGMVFNTLQYLQTVNPTLQFAQVNVSFTPYDADALVARVAAAIDALPPRSVRLACFSHITSVPAVVLPLKQLIEVCHARGVQVMVDGAHALGHIPIDVTALNADYYITNGHKWFYTPKGTAVLWVRSDRQSAIVPPTVSGEGQGKTPFQRQFAYEGTWDYSGFLSFEAAWQYRDALGDSAVMQYMHQLAVDGGNLLAAAWGTEKLLPDAVTPALVNVRLPPALNASVAQNLATLLLQHFNTWVPAYPLPDNGVWYVRVSAQIYNELSDFQMLADAVLALARGDAPADAPAAIVVDDTDADADAGYASDAYDAAGAEY